MPIDTVASVVAVLRQHRLLEPAQLDEVGLLQDRFPDPRALARELLQRGWLTAYQVNQLFQGKAGELVLGSYVLLERLGEGGMGQVFKARHSKLGRIVALKVIRQDRLSSAEALRRFRREILVAAQLSHPNVVHSYDADQIGDRHLIAMEFVDGIDLSRLVREKGPLPVGDACEYIRQGALGLQHAHEHALVHRDIKPSNLLLTPKPRPGVQTTGPANIKLLDLGLARVMSVVGEDTPSLVTQDGSLVGTPDFIAPEQARNAHRADIRADLYSLGCTFFYLLTGRPPFQGGSMTEKLLKHHWDAPPQVEDLRADVPRIVSAVIRKLLAKHPEDRFQAPADLANLLGKIVAPGGLDMPVPAELEFTPRPPEGEPPAAIPVAIPASEAVSAGALPQAILATPPSAGSTELVPPPAPRRPAPRVRWGLLAGVGTGVVLVAVAILLVGLLRPGTESSRSSASRTTAPQPTQPEAVQSPLDKLSRDKVASSERSALQTKEVVAVLGQHRGRHYGSVNSVACSPDGKTVASAGEDGVVRLWNLATLEQQEVLKGRGTGMTSVAYSPDGHLLASGDWAGVVRIWEPGRKGPGDPTQLEHDDGVTALAFSPDGRILAVALDDGTAQIWRLFPGERPRKGSLLTGHKDGLTSLAFSHDGQLLVTGSTDRTIRVWDRNTIPPRLQQVLTGHSSPVLAVAVGPDNQTVVSGSEGGRLRFWDAATGKSRDDARGTSFSASIQSIAFIPKGQQLILGLSDHRIVIVYFSKFGPKQGPTLTDVDAVSSVALAPMRRAIVTGTAAGTVRVWDWGFSGDPQERPMGRGHAGWLAGLVFTADGRSLYSAGRDRTVRLWELAAAEPQERAVFQGQGALSSLALSPDGKRLAAGGMYDSEIRLWELPATVPRTWKMSKEEQSHAAAVAFADPQTLVTAGQDTNKDGTIRIWDLAKTDPQAQTALRGHTSLVNSLALSQNGQVMASAGGSDASVRIWDLPRRRELHQFFGAKGGTVGPVALSPDGKLLAFSSSFTDEMLNRSDYSVALYDLGGAPPRPMPPLPGHAAQVLAVAFAPDGQKLATADEAGRLVLWERRTWQPLQDWRLPGPVSALVFAPDGRHLAVGNGNGTIYILRLKAATSRP